MSMAGIPILGFFAKLFLFNNMLQAGFIFSNSCCNQFNYKRRILLKWRCTQKNLMKKDQGRLVYLRSCRYSDST
jgi:NADH:ubiquinone oxidoreductase subunit 2 (subunit N)